jgi:phosphate starvation-inducible membrane PsiE
MCDWFSKFLLHSPLRYCMSLGLTGRKRLHHIRHHRRYGLW